MLVTWPGNTRGEKVHTRRASNQNATGERGIRGGGRLPGRGTGGSSCEEEGGGEGEGQVSMRGCNRKGQGRMKNRGNSRVERAGGADQLHFFCKDY